MPAGTEGKASRHRTACHLWEALLIMKRTLGTISLIIAVGLSAPGTESTPSPLKDGYAGSASCRDCHEKFYQLWSTSRHGLAMQPYTADFAQEQLTAQEEDIAIGEYRYRAYIDSEAGYVLETGAETKNKYMIVHVLGGKNVYYFLTTLEKGRLQTLPVAYDVKKNEWFDTALSGVRHIPEQQSEEPINWKEWPYTFNTSCYGCHVSQLAINYDLRTDTYKTAWKEPGINCETCHGPGEEHNRVAGATPKGQPLPEPKIISTKTMTKEQRNHLCASCHAKATAPLTSSYPPGERFFNHFDLVTLENSDYYPDGRDLGENYTYTSWLMSPCAKSGKLDCMHCHTSSGRYRFREKARANDACLPCHEARVSDASAHTYHKPDSPGSICVSCHMPMTSFARMNRSDHSMLPPTPAATLVYKSPNACNICHMDKDAAWADAYVRKWRERDYQAPALHRAGLIDAARKRDWSRLEDMLEYITSGDHDEVFTASLIRLLLASDDERAHRVFLDALKDPSPLVRAAAAEAVALRATQESLQALVESTGDAYRLVRIRAASALAAYPGLTVMGEHGERLKKANEEYLASLSTRPDQWTSHYNLGNYHLNRSEYKAALDSYETALKFEPRAVMAMVNSSITYAKMGENNKAEQVLRNALKVSPENAAANLNMGLLKAEKNDASEAEKYLKAAFSYDPRMAQAAFNLSVLVSKDRIDEAISWCGKAVSLRPSEPRYAYTLGFFQQQKGDPEGAIRTLDALITGQPAYLDAYLLLAEIYGKEGKAEEAKKVFNKALAIEGAPEPFKNHVREKLSALKNKP
jgi:tetratricopeptide (TPR) repeat protein